MAGSFEVAGQRVDYGSHRLHPATLERFLELFRALLGPDLQVRPRHGRIHLRGRWLAFPLRAGDMIRNLPVSFGARAALDAAASPLRRRRMAASLSFQDEVARRLGSAVAGEFYVPYARKLYGVEASMLDRELALRRVSASSAAEVLRRVVRAARPQGRRFLYPRAGYGQLSEALARAAVDAGVEVRMRSRVCGVETSRDGVLVRFDGGTIEADAILSTMPVPALARAVEPSPPAEVLEALERCRSRAVVLAYVVVGRDRFTPFDAHYFPGPETRVARLSEPKNYRDGDDPRGQTVLCAEIPCWPGDELWQSSDGSPEIIDFLNEALAAEVTAINQYFVNSKVCENWGWDRLAAKMREESIEEMHDAEKLMDRILYLEGMPRLESLASVRAGKTVEDQMENDRQLEVAAVARYRRGVALAEQHGDVGTRELLEHLLVGEEEHLDWIETQQTMIAAIGIQRYLQSQIGA